MEFITAIAWGLVAYWIISALFSARSPKKVLLWCLGVAYGAYVVYDATQNLWITAAAGILTPVLIGVLLNRGAGDY